MILDRFPSSYDGTLCGTPTDVAGRRGHCRPRPDSDRQVRWRDVCFVRAEARSDGSTRSRGQIRLVCAPLVETVLILVPFAPLSHSLLGWVVSSTKVALWIEIEGRMTLVSLHPPRRRHSSQSIKKSKASLFFA